MTSSNSGESVLTSGKFVECVHSDVRICFSPSGNDSTINVRSTIKALVEYNVNALSGQRKHLVSQNGMYTCVGTSLICESQC